MNVKVLLLFLRIKFNPIIDQILKVKRFQSTIQHVIYYYFDDDLNVDAQIIGEEITKIHPHTTKDVPSCNHSNHYKNAGVVAEEKRPNH